MGNIVELLGTRHHEAQILLPWYVSGRLEGPDRTCVETHLAQCAECRAELASERRLAVEWAAMPVETDVNWLSLRERLIRGNAGRASDTALSRLIEVARQATKGWRTSVAGAGWVLAAAQGFALVLMGVSFRTQAPVASYHTLGSAPASAVGNMLVMFNPDTSERRFRDAIEANHARLVDGPTASGAYVLQVPAKERAAALVRLQERPDIQLAQPIDPGVIR